MSAAASAASCFSCRRRTARRPWWYAASINGRCSSPASVMFFGTLEYSSGVAVDRKVTLVARTLADLTSQSISVSNADLVNFTTTGKAMLTPYASTPLNTRITELWIDPATSNARVQWSQGSSPARQVVWLPFRQI